MRRALPLLIASCAARAPVSPPAAPEPEPAPEQPEDPPPPAHPLATWFAALDRAEAGEGVASALHLGASHTASDTFTGPLREKLQLRFGDAGHGLAPVGDPWRWYRQEGMTWDQGGDWVAWRGTRTHARGPFGVGAVRMQAGEEDAWWSRGTCEDCPVGGTFDTLELHVLDTPGGGSFRVLVDDLETVVLSTTALDAEVEAALREAAPEAPTTEIPSGLPVPPDVGAFRVLSLPMTEDAPHQIRVEVAGDGAVSFLGASTLRDVPGVRYHALGVNGSRADQFLKMPEAPVVAQVDHLDPDLLVLHWGINEMFRDDWLPDDPEAPPEAWREAASAHTDIYVAMIERLRRGAPDASCLLLLPTDLAPTRHPSFPDDLDPCAEPVTHPWAVEPVCPRPTPRSHDAIRHAQLAAAEQAGCAVWDQQAAMGGAGSMNLWRHLAAPLAKDDGIHLSLEGYELMADALFRDLLDAWEAWRTGEPVPLATTPVDVAAWVEAHPPEEADAP